MIGWGDEDWAVYLVRALGRVKEAQGEFREEVAELRYREEEKDTENPHRFPGSNPSGYLDSFYHSVCHSGRQDDERFEPLRAALREAKNVLGRHRALAAVVEADEGWEQFVVCAFDRDYSTSRLAMVAGLLCRAQQAGENGLEIAAGELQSLLDRSVEGECGSAPNALTTGYHVLLFYGLRLSEEVEIAENLKLVSTGTHGSLSRHGDRAACGRRRTSGGRVGKVSAQSSKPFHGSRRWFGREKGAGRCLTWVRSTSTDETSWHFSRCSKARRW